MCQRKKCEALPDVGNKPHELSMQFLHTYHSFRGCLFDPRVTCAGVFSVLFGLKFRIFRQFQLLDELGGRGLPGGGQVLDPDRKTIKKMRGCFSPPAAAAMLFATNLFGCGYSQDEWDQKVRANEELRQKLAGEKSSRDKAEADYADALEEIEALRAQLAERGVNLDSLNASLVSQQKALLEYQNRMKRLDLVRQRFERLRQKLKELTRLGINVDVRDNRMVIQLPGDVLFDSGREELREGGKQIVLQVANVIAADDDLVKRQFQVAGHTDNRPLKGSPYKDNWGLSAMRARSVLRLLTDPVEEGGGGLPRPNWSAAGYGSTAPVASNESERGRAKNRRVELVVQPDVIEMLNLNSLADVDADPVAAPQQ